MKAGATEKLINKPQGQGGEMERKHTALIACTTWRFLADSGSYIPANRCKITANLIYPNSKCGGTLCNNVKREIMEDRYI